MARAAPTARGLQRLLNWWPPFWFAGIRVTHISDDFRKARVRLSLHWYNRNYVGTHFGGSLFAMTDPFWMIMVLRNLGAGYRVWDQAGRIEFKKAVRETVYCEFHLQETVLDELRAAAAGGDKVLRWFECEIKTAGGELVAQVAKQIYVRRAKGKPDAS
jgi:acyl-coenzyme A thioesterase PaaI-like protein